MGMILSPPSVPAVFHAMFTVPNIAIGNSMACRVYRDTKFGRINSSYTPRTSQKSILPKVTPPPQFSHQGSRAPYSIPTKTDYSGESTMSPEYGIHITTKVERTHDVPMAIMSGGKEYSTDKDSV
jgi:hypothetical protein